MKRFPIQYLDKAAFYTSLGAKLDKIEGKYPNNVYFVYVAKWLEFYEHHIGLVFYRKYIAQRKRLKRLSRRHSGLPERYTQKSKGFKMGEIATIKYSR